MSPATSSSARRGVIAVSGAFFIWGLLPLYLRPLHAVPALGIAAWRTIMGCLFVFAWLRWRGELSLVRAALGNSRICLRLLLSASLLTLNWTVYAWGVAHGQVLMTSLGYFINPLVNVLLGIVVLSETLNRLQWLAVALAASGVALLTVGAGEFPWIAFVLAITFSVYGLLRKTTPVAAMPGLAVETLLITPLAIGYLWWSAPAHGGVFHYSTVETVLLLCCGVVTIVPLSLFNSGARRINYTTVGMLQYIGPTMQFITGLAVFREPLSSQRLLCFVLIWSGLAVYAADTLWRRRNI